MKRILITGEHGYIGNAIRSYLSRWEDSYRVDMVSLRDDGWKAGSFRGYDVVIHAAGIVHQKESKDDPAQFPIYHRVNAILPCEVAGKAKEEGVGQFIFLSSESVYGCTARVGQTVEINADTPLNPADNYGRSKLEAEKLLRKLSSPEFHLAILRPPMIYGKGCKGNYNALSRLARISPVFPNVQNRRSMLYIDNLSELVRLLIEDQAEGLFCPQDLEPADVGQVAALIAQVHGKKLLLLPGFTWALKLLSGHVGAVDKAFGSLIYAKSLSTYPKNYCIKTLPEAIAETEG